MEGELFGIIYTQKKLQKKTDAEANKINKDSSIEAYDKLVDDVLKVSANFQSQIVDLQKRVAALESENYELKVQQLKDSSYIKDLEYVLKCNNIQIDNRDKES